VFEKPKIDGRASFCYNYHILGGMAEWLKAAVLKTAVAFDVTGGSNPSPSASRAVRNAISHGVSRFIPR
jgi:hypothetical protein